MFHVSIAFVLFSTLIFSPGRISHAASASSAALVERAIADMHMPSEALVIDPQFPWQHRPQVTMHAPRGDAIPAWWQGNRPQWTNVIVPWFTTFEAEGNRARNSRVQVKDLRLFILSHHTRQWRQVTAQRRPDVALWRYPFAAAGPACGITARVEGRVGISVLPAYPLFIHGWGMARTIDPTDVAATFTAMEFRLVMDDPRRQDDRHLARYVVDVGADYYPDQSLRWSLDFAPGVGNGRMLLARREWRTATLLVANKDVGVTLASLRNLPPPLRATSMDKPASVQQPCPKAPPDGRDAR